MLDWKNRTGSAQAREDRSAGRSTRKDSYFRGLLSRSLGVVVGLYLLVTIALGWYWSQEPALFPVQQGAQAAAEKNGQQMVVGYTTIETLKTVAGTLHFVLPTRSGDTTIVNDVTTRELGKALATIGVR